MSIDVALFAVLGRDPERKTSQAGGPYLRVNVGCGHGGAAGPVAGALDLLAIERAED